MKNLLLTVLALGFVSGCASPPPAKHQLWGGAYVSIAERSYNDCIAMQTERLQHGSDDLQVIADRIEANCQREFDHYLENVERDEALSDERKAFLAQRWQTMNKGKVLDDLLAGRSQAAAEEEAKKDTWTEWKLEGTALVASDNLHACVDAFVSRAMNQYDGYLAGRHLEPLVRKECRDEIDTLHHEIRKLDISNRGHLYLIGHTAYHTAAGIERIMETKQAEVKQAEIRKAVGY